MPLGDLSTKGVSTYLHLISGKDDVSRRADLLHARDQSQGGARRDRFRVAALTPTRASWITLTLSRPGALPAYGNAIQFACGITDHVIGKFMALAERHGTSLMFVSALGQLPILGYEARGGQHFHRLHDVCGFLRACRRSQNSPTCHCRPAPCKDTDSPPSPPKRRPPPERRHTPDLGRFN